MVSTAKVITNELVRKLVTYSDLIPAIELGLKNFSCGNVVQPVRSVLPVSKTDGFFMAMPAHYIDQNLIAIKCMFFYPAKGKQLSDENAQVLLYSTDNGILLAIMDADHLSAMRTAAASVVATKYLAKENSKILSVFGAGVQGKNHIIALSTLFSFDKIKIWNRTPENGLRLCEEMKSYAKTVEFCRSAAEAVQDADIVVTATYASTPILQGKWLKEGVHVNCVGACRPNWRELDDDCMNSCELFVDSRPGALQESGDIILSKKPIVGEVGELVSGEVTADRSKRTLFKSLGMAVEDAAAASVVWKNFQKSLSLNSTK